MANLRGSIVGYRHTGSTTQTSRIASEAIAAQLNTWAVDLETHLLKDGSWTFTLRNYRTGEEYFKVNGAGGEIENVTLKKRKMILEDDEPLYEDDKPFYDAINSL